MIEVKLDKDSRIYISGAMASTNLPDKNYTQFFEAENILRKYFNNIINPAALGSLENEDWHKYLKRDLKLLIDCDAIIMLPGWDTYKSKGASLEKYVAESLGIDVYYYSDILNFISNNFIPTPSFE